MVDHNRYLLSPMSIMWLGSDARPVPSPHAMAYRLQSIASAGHTLYPYPLYRRQYINARRDHVYRDARYRTGVPSAMFS